MIRMLLTLVALGLTLPLASAQEDKSKEDMAAVSAYLKEKYAAKKWQTGPTRVDTPQLQKMWPKHRFYYVFSAAPLPPGANIDAVQKAFRERLKDYQDNFISLTVALDKDGKVMPLAAPADYQKLLPKVKSADEAKDIAALIMTLYPQNAAPQAVLTKNVQIVKDAKEAKGWTCQAEGKWFSGTVVFDAQGQVTSISKSYAGPVPP